MKLFANRSRPSGRSYFGKDCNMKLTQNKVIHLLLGVFVLTTIGLLYMLLLPHGLQTLAPSMWAIFGMGSFALILAAFLPSIIRYRRGLPAPKPMNRREMGIYICITLIGCILSFYGVFSGMWWMMTLGIMFAPLYFIFSKTQTR